jgi:anaphase-promoting complex subunit 1
MKSAAAAGGFPGKLVDRPTLETCVGVAAIALSLVMAGTGDLAALRLLRRLRLRLDVAGVAGAAATAATAAAAATTGAGGAAGLSHGAHVAISMALGFLFLGGGTKTFATDDASIAALLISIYPRFPQNTNDQRCHLQAFRHLYALAARSRLLETVDAATRKPVYAPVEMTFRSARAGGAIETRRVTAPCLLPEEGRLISLNVVGDRYWPVRVDVETGGATVDVPSSSAGARTVDAAAVELLYRRRQLPVQRLTGALPYAADPTGARAGLAKALRTAAAAAALRPQGSAFTTRTGSHGDQSLSRPRALEDGTSIVAATTAETQDAVGLFTSDPSLLGFKRLVCEGGGELAAFSTAALHECLTREEPGALASYVHLRHATASLLAAAENASAFDGAAGGAGSSSAARASWMSEGEALTHAMCVADARLLAAYASRRGASSSSSRTLPPSLTDGFNAATVAALEAPRYGAKDGVLCAYLRGASFAALPDAAGLFGAYLAFFDVPTPAEVSRAMTLAGVPSGADEGDVLRAVKMGVPGVRAAAALRVARCGV